MNDNNTKSGVDIKKEPEYKNIFNAFKMTSPVYKLNIEPTNPRFVLGVYLMSHTQEDIRTLLKNKAIMDDLCDDTILFFEMRHLMELVSILYGMLTPAVTAKTITKNTIKIKTDIILDELSKPIYYSSFKAFIKKFCIRLTVLNSFTQEYADRIAAVMEYIWFIPYVSLDEIVSNIIEEYQNETGEIILKDE